MKTYILDTIERFKRYSQKLDVKTILCSKAWYVLNEDGDTENLVFQEDGSVLVSINGSTTKHSWQYIPQNNSLNIMHSEKEGTMLKPAFMDGKVLAFNKIGTKECMFLVDDSINENEKILSLDAVKKYLLRYEERENEREKRLHLRKLVRATAMRIKEQERQRQKEEERKKEEEKRKKILEEKKRVVEHFASKERLLKDKYDYENTEKWYGICQCGTVSYDPFYSISFWFIWIVLFFIFFGLGLYYGLTYNWDEIFLILMGLVALPVFPISYLLSLWYEKWFAYKIHKIFYDEYVEKTGESLEEFSYRIFYDIKSDYEEYVKKVSELDAEKEKALKQIASS
jgi:hypothetical protein